MSTAKQQEQEVIRISRELLSRDVLSELSTKSCRLKKDFPHTCDPVLLSQESSNRPDIKNLHEGRVGNSSVRNHGTHMGHEADTVSEDNNISIASEDSLDNLSKDSPVPNFVELSTLSVGLRRTAAPHIYNIFEQIFMEDSTKDSSLGSHQDTRTVSSGRDYVIKVQIIMKHKYDDIVSSSTGRGRFQFERSVFGELSSVLGVSRDRFGLEKLEGQPGQYGHVVLDVLVRRDKSPGSPSSSRLGTNIVDGVYRGLFKQTTLMSKAISAEIINEHGRGLITSLGGGEKKSKFLLPSGGLCIDSKQFGSNVGGEDASLASHGARSEQSGMDADRLRLAFSIQEKQIEAARQRLMEKREREGFWVDVEEGNVPEATAKTTPGEYGTFTDEQPRSSRGAMFGWVLGLGAVVLAALIVRAFYRRFSIGASE